MDIKKIVNPVQLPKETRNKGIGIVLVVFFLFFIFGVLAGAGDDDKNGGSGSEYQDQLASCSYSKLEVEKQLKSPDTAEFQTCASAKYEKLADRSYRVTSWVKSENSFGSRVFTDFSCDVQLTDTDEYYIKCSLK